VATIETSTASIEFTELLEDATMMFYYLTLQDLDFVTLSNFDYVENISLYLTRSNSPSVLAIDDTTIQVECVESI
jgi:hypothetical protein